MLPKYKSVMNAICIFLFLIGVSVLLPAYAQNEPTPPPPTSITNLTAQGVMSNIAANIPNLMKMVTAIAYVMGMVFIFRGIILMKHLGESRTMVSREHSPIGPIIMLTVGALLLYLPTAVYVGMSTFWVNPNPYGYMQEQYPWTDVVGAAYLIIQLVGVIAFIRGLVIMSQMAGQQHGPGIFSKGLTHIIGGILCINIYQTVQVVLITLGIQS